MGIVKEILLNFNSFQSPQFFRFNGQPQFTNILGGIFTILIRGLLLMLLVIKLIDVFNYRTVISSAWTKYQIDQNAKTLMSPMDKNSPFLIGVQVLVERSNMSMTELRRVVYGWSYNVSGKYTYLQHCTPEHWAAAPGFYDAVVNSTQPNQGFLLCLPLNFTHNLDVTQQSVVEMSIALYCGGNCSSAQYTKLMVRPIIYNRLINAQQNIDYLTDFLDKKRYYAIDTVGSSFDVALSYQISKYSIQTDQSILPWQNVKEEHGIFIPNQPGISYHPNRYPYFAMLRMFYSLTNQQFYYHRSFSKIFDAVSLVGGLIPVFMILFIWLYYYALAHFQMTFIKKLHSDQKAKQYGLFYFFSKVLYTGLSFLNVNMKNWEKTHQYHKMHKVVNRHLLDVIYLYKRLQFIERTLQVLLEDHQKKVLHLMRNKTFNQAEGNYNLYQMKPNLAKFVGKMKKQKEERMKKFRSKQIILEPVQLIQTEKNLIPMKQFQGQVQERENPLKSSQIIPPNEIVSEKSQKPPEQEEDSEYNQEMEKMEIQQLRSAYASYLQLKKQAEDCNSDYFSVISRNILNKMDEVDKELLNDLEQLLHNKVREQIMTAVQNILKNKEQMIAQDSLYRRRNGSRILSSLSNSDRQFWLRSSKSLRRKAQITLKDKESQKEQHKKQIDEKDEDADYSF